MRNLRMQMLSFPAASVSGGAASSPNPNLLLWSEELQRAEWTAVGDVSLTQDAGIDPNGGMTADELSFGSIGAVFGQTSGIAASTGSAAISTVTLTSSYSRASVSGTFDGVVYFASVYLVEPSGAGSDIQFRLEISGGFLRVSLRDAGDDPTLRAWGWKLETPTLTDYVKTEGG